MANNCCHIFLAKLFGNFMITLLLKALYGYKVACFSSVFSHLPYSHFCVWKFLSRLAFVSGIRRVGRRPDQQAPQPGQPGPQQQGGPGETRPSDRRPDRRPPRERRFDKPSDEKPEGSEFSVEKWVPRMAGGAELEASVLYDQVCLLSLKYSREVFVEVCLGSYFGPC